MSKIARWSALIALVALALAILTEHVLEVRDAARLTADDTFCSVQGKRVRYRLVGAGKPGPTIVLLSGLGGSIEQWQDVQDTFASAAPVLAYDRGGVGFSEASDAHDPDAQAEELDGLLHAAHISPPFVLVGYSGGAVMLRVFVARHEDEVKGVVLIDPLWPTPKYPYWRVYASLRLKALVGWTRIKDWRSNPARTRREEKARAITVSFHHYSAAAAEAVTQVSTADWRRRLMAAPAFGPIPVRVLCTFDPASNPETEDLVVGSRQLAAESPKGQFEAKHVDHTAVLSDPAALSTVIDLIRTVEDHARAAEIDPP